MSKISKWRLCEAARQDLGEHWIGLIIKATHPEHHPAYTVVDYNLMNGNWERGSCLMQGWPLDPENYCYEGLISELEAEEGWWFDTLDGAYMAAEEEREPDPYLRWIDDYGEPEEQEQEVTE